MQTQRWCHTQERLTKTLKKKAVLVYSGGIDSVCAATMLADKYDIYGITFSYGQRAKREIVMAKKLARHLGMKKHKIVDIGFMKSLYGDDVLTNSKRIVPDKFEYSIVVPIRNAVFFYSIKTRYCKFSCRFYNYIIYRLSNHLRILYGKSGGHR